LKADRDVLRLTGRPDNPRRQAARIDDSVDPGARPISESVAITRRGGARFAVRMEDRRGGDDRRDEDEGKRDSV